MVFSWGEEERGKNLPVSKWNTQNGRRGNREILQMLPFLSYVPSHCLQLKLSVVERSTPAQEGFAFLLDKHLQFGRTC